MEYIGENLTNFREDIFSIISKTPNYRIYESVRFDVINLSAEIDDWLFVQLRYVDHYYRRGTTQNHMI